MKDIQQKPFIAIALSVLLAVTIILNGLQLWEAQRLANLHQAQLEKERTEWAGEREMLEGQAAAARQAGEKDQKKAEQIKILKDKLSLIERDMTLWDEKIAADQAQLDEWARQIRQNLATNRTAQAESLHKNLESQLNLMKYKKKEFDQDGVIRTSLEKQLFDLIP